jgi:DNA-binding XRE family transcriptional regulator/mannose-6-phosphate isomerase-like protein (cupin superfamily)
MSEAVRTDADENLPTGIGERLRHARTAKGVSARAFARSLGVSPSLISQIELGKALPSVGTLMAIVSSLGISLDELFFDSGSQEAAPGGPVGVQPSAGRKDVLGEGGVVLRPPGRRSITLGNSVHWQRLTPDHDYDVDFLYVTYDPGAESCPEDALMTHSGKEYGLVLAGRLGATVGFVSYELEPGDSIAFESALPHRFWTVGDVPTSVVWTVVGRLGDPRFPSNRPSS